MGEVREDLKRSEAWLGFEVPESDNEPSFDSESTAGSTAADPEANNLTRPDDLMIDNPCLSSVTTQRGASGSSRRKNKKKKNKRGNRQGSETSSHSDQVFSLARGNRSPVSPSFSSPSHTPSSQTSTGGLGGSRGRGRGRGTTPGKTPVSRDPVVGVDRSGHATRDDIALPETCLPVPGHNSPDLRTDCSGQSADVLATDTPREPSLVFDPALHSKGMYLSSISHWNTGSYDIPQQFMTSLEPPYRIAMGSSVPLYSMHGPNVNLPHSMFALSAGDFAVPGPSIGLSSGHHGYLSSGHEYPDVSTEVKLKSAQSNLSSDSSTKTVDSSLCTPVQ